MPRRAGIVPKHVLVDAELPEATDTYTVISHEQVIDTALNELRNRNFSIKEEEYKCNLDARVAQGIYRLNYGDDPDLGMMFSFANSYDKSMRFKCAVGGYVHTNKASVISSNMSSWGRKHTGTADDEAEKAISAQLEDSETYFSQLLYNKERMKDISLTHRQYAQLLGVLYFELNLLTGEQMGIISREYDKPSFNYTTDDDSLWTLYNHILVALGKSHPRTWMDQQKLVHFHLLTEFAIADFDEDDAADGTGTHETEPTQVSTQTSEVDPAQIDLEDSIREIEEEAVLKVESIMISAADLHGMYEGADVGDTVTIMDVAYEVVSQEEVDGAPGFNLVAYGNTTGSEEEEDVAVKDAEEAFVEATDETPAENQEVTELPEAPLAEEAVEESVAETESEPMTEEELSHQLHGVDNDIEVSIPAEPDPVAEEESTDEETVADDTEEDDPVRSAISSELYELFGTIPAYEYELSEDQYNITLETGETISLLEEYINQKTESV